MIDHIHIDKTTTDRVVRITAAGWDGQIYRSSRNAFFEWRRKGRDFPSTSVAYVLYADHFDKCDGSDLYVGHSEQAEQRWTVHDSDKDYWTTALMFTSMGDWMNSAHTKRIEHEMIKWAEGASRYSVRNGNRSAPGVLGELDEITVNRYLNPVRHILQMVGIDVFAPNPAGTFRLEEYDAIGRKTVVSTLRIRSFDPPRVEFLSGSEMVVSNDAARTELVASGAAEVDGRNSIKFTRDYDVAIDANISGVQFLFGRSARKWINANRRELSEALKLGRSAVLPTSEMAQPESDRPN